MSVTSGFFNSLNHDRRYNAQQFSALFDGIINDGVFANIGAAFAIKADTGVTVTIDKGKAWFNSAWVYNDSLLPKTLEGAEVVLDRIDAVVIEVDHSEAVRLGDIKIVKGTPSSSPQRPAMANTANKHQYPLAYIYRKAGSTAITQADITNMVGTSSCPYITGILQVQNTDNIVAQWEAQWNQWYAEKVSDTNSDSSELLAEMKSDFDIWFADVKALLDDDVATELAGKVAELQGKFDDLASEGAVYDTLEDANLDVILGSDGTPIQGKTVLGGADVGLIDAYTLQGRKAEDFRSADWMPTAEEVGAVPTSRTVNGKVLTGDITLKASDVGAAPSGYGLGGSVATKKWADVDSLKSPGWYKFSGAVSAGGTTLYSPIMRVDSSDSSHGVQTLLPHGAQNYRLVRKISDSKWGEWEWENPPMIPGSEYRTTERFNKLPVYAKVVPCGKGPYKTVKSVSHGASAAQVLRSLGTCSSGVTAGGIYDMNSYLSVWADKTNVYLSSPADQSSVDIDVQMFYVKS